MLDVLSILRIRFLSAFVIAACCCSFVNPGFAQTYPSKRITLMVPSPPGGGPDIWARIIADKLQERWGQPVIVENRTGAGGLIGAGVVAKAPADGYTLLVSANTLGTAAHIFKKTGGDGLNVMKDLKPFITLGLSQVVVVVHSDLGVKSLPELVELAKRPPGLTYASSGVGTLLHMAGELFDQSAGIKMTHVPYPGAAQAITDLIGRHVDVLFTGYAAVAPQLGGTNKLIALGIINEGGRSALAPNIPTFEEQGYKGVDALGWYGVYARTDTPAPIVAKLNEEINAILKLPEVRERGVATGLEVTGGTAKDANDRYVKEYDVFGKVIKDANIAEQ